MALHYRFHFVVSHNTITPRGRRVCSKLLTLAKNLRTRRSEMHLQGIVAKRAGWAVRGQKAPSWVKVKNPSYSQAEGRVELFEKRMAVGASR